MWPSTLYPEKTYRFLKNVWNDSYGRKKSATQLDQARTQSASSGCSSAQLEASRRAKSSHACGPDLLPSPPSTFSSGSGSFSADTSSTPSPVFGTSGHHSRKQPMTRLFHHYKSVAHDVKHKLSLSRLPKIDSTESEEGSKEEEAVRPCSAQQQSSGRYQHQPLYYRASSPVFDQRLKEMHLMYAASGRLHHSEPLSRTSTQSLPVYCGEYSSPLANVRQRASPSISPGTKSGHHLFPSQQQQSTDALSPRLAQRRLSYRSYEGKPIAAATEVDTDEDEDDDDSEARSEVVERRDGARTVLLDKFTSDVSVVQNRDTGGITLCGGVEVGLSSIYISRVAPNSAADKCGLSPGDQILSANYVSFLENISVKRAYEVLHSNGSHSVLLTFLPRREAFAPRQRRHHCFSWIDPEGRSVSPPPPDRELVDIPGEVSAVDSVVESRQLERTFRRAPRLKDLHRASASTHAPFHRKSSLSGGVRQVTITLEKGIDLGLMIRGGIEYGLGIYVTRVDLDSLADKANLSVGDQILSVNDFDFSEVLHDEAVNILKSAARLVMKVLFVGKVPVSTYSPMDSSISNWSPRHSPRHHYFATGSSSSEMHAVGSGGGNFGRATSPTAGVMNSPGSPLLSRHSPHHHHRLTPLSHSNSSPCSSPGRHHHQHSSLHQSHSYRGECISPRFARAKETSSMSPFDKRDTPTLLITDSDNRELSGSVHALQISEHVEEDDDDDENELYVLRVVDRNIKNYRGLRRKRLQNTKSEEDEQILDEECLKYLNDKERLTLAYYRNEYETKAMTVDTLVALLADLLDTNEKYSVIFRLYHVIRPEDVGRFDDLVCDRDQHDILKRKAIAEEKYKRFFKQCSSETNSSFECPSAVDTADTFEEMASVMVAGPAARRMVSVPTTVAPNSHEYDAATANAAMDLSPSINVVEPHHYHLDLHDQTMAANNRLAMHRPLSSGTLQKQPSPNSAAYRKTFMTRRHSSGTSDTPIVRDTSPQVNTNGTAMKPLVPYGSFPLVADERRWSIAAAECRRPSVLFNPVDLRRRSPSPVASFNRTDHQHLSREDIEASQQQQQQLSILSRKGSSSSCCQEVIAEADDTQLTPNSPIASGTGLGPASGPLRGSGNHLHVPSLNDAGSDTEDNFQGFPNHLRVRRHRSLPSPTFSTEKLLSSNFPVQQRSSSFRLPSHRAVSEPNGRWRIKVKKTKSFLGIAIEGGENVNTQSQPRIISIHSSGAAVECGDLHVGHIILEVDGQSTATLNHEQVAQMISRAYYNTPHKDYIEFLVREKSRNEFDLRRSSFMLLNNSFE